MPRRKPCLHHERPAAAGTRWGRYGSEWGADAASRRARRFRGACSKNAYVTQAVCTPARASIMTGPLPAHRRPDGEQDGPCRPKLPSWRRWSRTTTSADTWASGTWATTLRGSTGFDVWIRHGGVPSGDLHSTGNCDVSFSDYHHHLVANGFRTRPRGRRRPDVLSFGQGSAARRIPDGRRTLPTAPSRFIDDNSGPAVSSCTSAPSSRIRPTTGPFRRPVRPRRPSPTGPAFLTRPEGAALVNRIRGRLLHALPPRRGHRRGTRT